MKIAVVRALQLGDLLCAVPALRALHEEFPAARLSLVGLPWAREFAERFRRYLFDFVEFPGFPGLPEHECNVSAVPRFFDEMNRRRFDLVLQMHGSGEITNPLVVLMGGQRVAGYCRKGAYRPDAERFLEWNEREHEVRRCLRLAEHVGAPSRGSHLEFPLTAQDWAEWNCLGLEAHSYAVVHPGSQLPSRRWPAERFARVADALADDGLRIVVTGTHAEKPLTQAVLAQMQAPARDLSGDTSVGGLAAVIARARLLVSNDTGVSHIAAAVGTPSVIVSCGSDPARWAPLDGRLHHVLHQPVECRPCAHAVCPIGHPCALGVSVNDVLSEVRRLAECAA